jgi:tetratricopeptide (TPR) repeat protein
MKKVVFALVLAAAAFAVAPLTHAQVTIKDAAEYNEYTNAIGQSAPAAKAAAIETFLTHYPQSVVYKDTLEQLVQAYSQIPDPAKSLDAADRLLKLDPNNARAILTEVFFKSSLAAAATDPTAKQNLLDDAASFSKKGLALTKPAGVSDADWKKTTDLTTQTYHSAIASAAFNKGDYPTAISEFTAELNSIPVEQTATPSQALQDTFNMGVAYFKQTPPDYVKCVWYADRAAHFAPPAYQAQMLPTAKYCYNKFHGKPDGFDAVEALQAPTQLTPPATLVITPAPKPEDIAHDALKGVTDMATVALEDKEYILVNGTLKADVQPADATTPVTDADRVWASFKGQNIKLTDKLVVSATDTVVTLAVSDDAVQGPTADFSVTMKVPLKTVPTVGTKFTVIGTVDSYDKAPFLIHLIDGEVPAAKAPVRKPTAAHRTTTH